MDRIFITGGASGLGAALARRYAAAGWRVCIGDVNELAGRALARELDGASGRVIFRHCDVTRERDLQAVADDLQAQWGGLDVVVNNAGVAAAGAIHEQPLAHWQWLMDINLFGVVRGCKVFAALFREQGHGHIVNIASMAGIVHPALMGAYNASKAAVVALSETLHAELTPHGIHVTVVCPSFFRTALNQSMKSTLPGVEKRIEKLFDASELSADDIAGQVMAAVADRQVYLLPHRDGRRARLLKRLLPFPWFARLLMLQPPVRESASSTRKASTAETASAKAAAG